jgi:hypothetical protein
MAAMPNTAVLMKFLTLNNFITITPSDPLETSIGPRVDCTDRGSRIDDNNRAILRLCVLSLPY